MFELGQSVVGSEATPAAVGNARRRARLALLPTDAQILANLRRASSADSRPRPDEADHDNSPVRPEKIGE